jgi:hypothetical protein
MCKLAWLYTGGKGWSLGSSRLRVKIWDSYYNKIKCENDNAENCETGKHWRCVNAFTENEILKINRHLSNLKDERLCLMILLIGLRNTHVDVLIKYFTFNNNNMLIIPRRWNRSGDIVLALSVRPSVRPNFVSGLVLCNYWLEFNETLWESSISRGDEHILALFRSDTLIKSYGPWLVMQYTYRAKIDSALLLCNYWLEFIKTLWELQYQEEMCIWSACSGQIL